MAYLSYLGEHWTLFIIVVLSVIVLGALSWFLKNWKFAAAAIVLVIFGLAYQSSNMDGYKRKVNEDAQAQISEMGHRLLALQIVGAQDAQRALTDNATIDKLKDLASVTPQNSRRCLSRAAARRVRDISDVPVAAPLPSSRISDLFQRRHGGP